jgi:hypothetical protein
VRYRAIVHKAGEDILELMKAMVELCPKPNPDSGEGTFDLMSVLVTGIVAVSTTVISGGATAAILLGTAVLELLGEGIKTAERTPPENRLLLENKYYLADVARQYMDGVNKIERDTAQAVTDLRDNMRRELDGLRHQRTYQPKLHGSTAEEVPFFRDYLYR